VNLSDEHCAVVLVSFLWLLLLGRGVGFGERERNGEGQSRTCLTIAVPLCW
jgi:hypothetical protein